MLRFHGAGGCMMYQPQEQEEKSKLLQKQTQEPAFDVVRWENQWLGLGFTRFLLRCIMDIASFQVSNILLIDVAQNHAYVDASVCLIGVARLESEQRRKKQKKRRNKRC